MQVSKTSLSQVGELRVIFSKPIFGLPFRRYSGKRELSLDHEGIDITEAVKVEVINDDIDDDDNKLISALEFLDSDATSMTLYVEFEDNRAISSELRQPD